MGSDESSLLDFSIMPRFNPRSPCGERHVICDDCLFWFDVSIHAPRVGSDHHNCSLYPPARFNPRSPCGERLFANANFATQSGFNPRSPCGERQVRPAKVLNNDTFQSTLPVWGATHSRGFVILPLLVSIHAPRVGSDIITLN